MKNHEPSSVILLDQLKDACKLLTGDVTNDIIEDAAVFTLRMFLDQELVMLKHLSQLRQMFGTVLSSTANKICEVILKLYSVSMVTLYYRM